MAVFNHTKHRELWNWLAHNPGCIKEEWPGWKECEKAKYFCFACEAVKTNVSGCVQCPLKWETVRCTDDESPYNKWLVLTDSLRYGELQPEDKSECMERLKKLAFIIANIPLRNVDGLEVI